MKGLDQMKYMAKFDSTGIREASVVAGVHFSTAAEKQAYLDQGYIEISDADQALYATNEYVKGSDGKPTAKPAYVETKADKANALAATYNGEIAELKDSLATATLSGDTTTIEELKTEYGTLLTEYNTALEAL